MTWIFGACTFPYAYEYVAGVIFGCTTTTDLTPVSIPLHTSIVRPLLTLIAVLRSIVLNTLHVHGKLDRSHGSNFVGLSLTTNTVEKTSTHRMYATSLIVRGGSCS